MIFTTLTSLQHKPNKTFNLTFEHSCTSNSFSLKIDKTCLQVSSNLILSDMQFIDFYFKVPT